MSRVCLITGASGKLGLALCRTLPADYDIVACYRTEIPAAASQVRWPVDPNARQLESQFGSTSLGDRQQSARDSPARSVYCVQADLTHRADIQRIVEVVAARYGRADLLINAAADVRFHGQLLELWQSGDQVVRQLEVNAIAPVVLTAALFHSFWKDEPGLNAVRNANVINVSSGSALSVTQARGQGFYAASKAALNILTMFLALELAPYSVRVNAICPGRFAAGAGADKIARDIAKLAGGSDTGLIL